MDFLKDFKASAKCGLLGFDGFVDELYSVVNKRYDSHSFDSLNQISDFSAIIAAAAGKSANIELYPKVVKAGGNGPLMGRSLQKLGECFMYIGAIGKESIHPLFADFAKGCPKVLSLCEPARSQALEFNDGKIMLCQLNDLTKINRENIEQFLQDELANADYFCFLNWTELPEMNGIYQCFLDLLKTQESVQRRPFFADLADFRRRSVEDIDQVLAHLQGISQFLDVYLGLNQSEARQMSLHLGLKEEGKSLSDLAQQLQDKLKLQEICVHSHREVASFSSRAESIETLYIPKPKISTGAGDHFNAGYFFGIINQASQGDCLKLGVLNSAYYVSTAETGDLKNLKDFLKNRALT